MALERAVLRASSTQGHLVFEAQEKLPPWRCSAEAADACAAASTYTMATACAAAASGTVAARGCRQCHQPLLSLWYTLRGCSVQCFTFSYSPGGCGSWGSSLASVSRALSPARAAAIEVLLTSEEATQPYMRYLLRQQPTKKKGKKEIHALLVRAPLLLTCFLKESNIFMRQHLQRPYYSG